MGEMGSNGGTRCSASAHASRSSTSGTSVAAGFVYEIVLAKYRFPPPQMLTLILLLAGAGHLFISFSIPGSLYFSSVRFTFEAQRTILFAVISEIFGLKYCSTLYNFGAMASPWDPHSQRQRGRPHLYDGEVLKQRTLGLTPASHLHGSAMLQPVFHHNRGGHAFQGARGVPAGDKDTQVLQERRLL